MRSANVDLFLLLFLRTIMSEKSIQHFYINEQQSIYLLSHHDAKKHRQWLNICKKQLSQLGYKHVEVIGSGAFGFVFAGTSDMGKDWVFKFSRITLAQSVRDRLEDEAICCRKLTTLWCQTSMPSSE